MKPKTYVLTNEHAIVQVSDAFTTRFRGITTSIDREHRIYLDTFDWRLFSAGCTLHVQAGEPHLLLLEGSDAAMCRIDAFDTPLFSEQLPVGRLRTITMPILGIRSLLPLYSAQIDSCTFRLLNKRGKSVAIASIQVWHVTSDTANKLPIFIEVLPIKGHRGAFNDLCRFIEHELDGAPSNKTLFLIAAHSAGLEPNAPDNLSDLSEDMRADEALVKTYKSLLDTMLINEPGLRVNLDTEFLHDYRVALRRTRSLLAQVRNVLPDDKVKHFKEEFRWLGAITSPQRDLDVYLLRMDDYRVDLADSVNYLEPLADYLQEKQRLGLQRLVAQLDSSRYRELIADWSEFLEGPMPHSDDCFNAGIPARQLVSHRIWRAYRRVYKQGVAITPATSMEALHALRIECKKLRYLIEIFADLFPQRVTKQLLKPVKALHNNLGNLNDFGTQREKLQQFSSDMRSADIVPPECIDAMDRLMSILHHRQEIERDRFAVKFNALACARTHHKFKDLFKVS